MAYPPPTPAPAPTSTPASRKPHTHAYPPASSPSAGHPAHPSNPTGNANGGTGPGGNAKGKGKEANKGSRNKIWSTSSTEERERIKEFWLGLGEEERRGLVKVEKDTVLRKMKEQQKHSCGCAVCGRKRCVSRLPLVISRLS